MNDSTQNSLRTIDGDLLDFLNAKGLPSPPETTQDAADTSERYMGTAEDFSRALAMRQAAAHRATERDRADARRCAEVSPVADQDDPATKDAAAILRKMLIAESLGIATWTGTTRWSSEPGRWLLDPVGNPQSSRKPDSVSLVNRRRFTELEIRQSFRKVRQTSPDSWTACCPAHHDRNPSVTIRRGRTHWLFKCWSQGCSWIEIIQAAGLGNIDTRIGASR